MVEGRAAGGGEQRQRFQVGGAQGGQGPAHGRGGAPAGVQDQGAGGQHAAQVRQVGVEETSGFGLGVGVRADIEDVGVGAEHEVRLPGGTTRSGSACDGSRVTRGR